MKGMKLSLPDSAFFSLFVSIYFYRNLLGQQKQLFLAKCLPAKPSQIKYELNFTSQARLPTFTYQPVNQ